MILVMMISFAMMIQVQTLLIIFGGSLLHDAPRTTIHVDVPGIAYLQFPGISQLFGPKPRHLLLSTAHHTVLGW